MAISTKSPTLPSKEGASASNSVQATVTGVSRAGQLFRDNSTLVYLKDRKCIYLSKFAPASDAALMIEIRSAQGREAWRSNAKVKGVSPVPNQPDTFRITVDLDTPHSLVIEPPEPAQETPPDAASPAFEDPAPTPAKTPSSPPKSTDEIAGAALTGESRRSDTDEPPEVAPAPSAFRKSSPAAPAAGSGSPVKTAPVPKTMVTDIVRSVMASDFGQLKQDLQSAVSAQVEAAVREPLRALERKVEHQFRSRPALTEETVRIIAAEAAENVLSEWASSSLRSMVTDAVRTLAASERDQRRREIESWVSSGIEAAMRGPLTDRMETAVAKAVDSRWEQHARTQPKVTDEMVRRIALEAAENVQREWATTKLAAMVTDLMRKSVEAEFEKRERQIKSALAGEIEAALGGPFAARLDAMVKKGLEARWEEHAREPAPITDEMVRRIAAAVAGHPQLQNSMEALAANLSERWMEIARGASSNAQQDLKTRVAASERLAHQVVSDIQEKLNSFGVEMDRIFGRQPSDSRSSAPAEPRDADLQDREKRFREVLQSAGSQFEREMKTALQKIFGKL
jgi:hypothetical protein